MNYAWQATVQDEQGNAVVNPVVTVWEADGVTLATIYDVTGAVIPNPITGSLEGFVQFWASDGEYRIEGASGGEETEVWSWIAGVNLSGIEQRLDDLESSGGVYVAVEVAAVDVPVVVASIATSGYYSSGDGGAASYVRVSSEPSHGLKLQSSDGAWWELAEKEPTLRMAGAKFLSDDDTDAWNNILDYCYDKGVGNFKIGSGILRVTSPNPIHKPITITGDGPRNSIISCYGENGVIVSGAQNGVRAADVRLAHFSINGTNMTSSDPSDNYKGTALVIDFTQATVLDQVAVYDSYNGIFCRQTGNNIFNGVTVDGALRGPFAFKAYGTNTARNGQNDQIDVMQFNNCLFQSNYPGTGPAPATELMILDGRVHSIQINGVRCLSGLRGFVTRNTPSVAPAFVPRFIIGSGLESEQTYAEGFLFEAADDVRLSDTFCARSTTASGIVAGAAVGSITISKGYSGSHYLHDVNNQGCAFLTLVDFNAHNNSLGGGDLYSGIYVSGSGRVMLRGGTFGKNTWIPAYTENQKYGVDINPTFNGEIKLDGLNLTGNVSGPIYEVDAANTASSSYARGCTGYNHVGAISRTIPSSGGIMRSGFRDEFISIIGGSGVSINIDGIFISNYTPCSFMLPARTTATITYTTAPTIASIVM